MAIVRNSAGPKMLPGSTDCICLNCGSNFKDTDVPVFIGEILLTDQSIKIQICKKCMKTAYIKEDRLLQKAYKKIGEKAVFTESELKK